MTGRAIVFTGGGTAGHVMPSLPVMARFVDAGWRVHYVGSSTGPEATLVADRGYDFHGIAAGKLRRYLSFENVIDVFRILRGIAQSFALLGRLRPAVVFSKGGFVTFPVVFAAWLRRVPVVAHESDLTPGLANRLALPFVTALCTNFSATKISGRRGARLIHTGTPMRPELLAGDRERGRRWLGAVDDRPIVVVVGGSMGAEAINGAVRAALDRLDRYFVVHVCGAGRCDPGRDRPGQYQQFEFVGAQWGDVLAAADVVVSRAGANSLYELVALRKPHVLVPLSRKASRGDQIENADYAVSRGWSRSIDEGALTVESLVEAIDATHDESAAILRRLDSADLGDGTGAIVEVLEHCARGA